MSLYFFDSRALPLRPDNLIPSFAFLSQLSGLEQTPEKSEFVESILKHVFKSCSKSSTTLQDIYSVTIPWLSNKEVWVLKNKAMPQEAYALLLNPCTDSLLEFHVWSLNPNKSIAAEGFPLTQQIDVTGESFVRLKILFENFFTFSRDSLTRKYLSVVVLKIKIELANLFEETVKHEEIEIVPVSSSSICLRNIPYMGGYQKIILEINGRDLIMKNGGFNCVLTRDKAKELFSLFQDVDKHMQETSNDFFDGLKASLVDIFPNCKIGVCPLSTGTNVTGAIRVSLTRGAHTEYGAARICAAQCMLQYVPKQGA